MSKEIYRRFGFDWLMFLSVLVMIAFGLLMVFSSSAHLGIENHDNALYYFIHQVIGAAAGMAIMLLIMSWSKPFYGNPLFVYGLLILTIGMLALALMMPAVNNTNRWIRFFGLHFQPSELAKISLILFLAFYLDRKKDALGDMRTLLLPVGMIGIVLLLIFKEPDMSTTILVFTICVVMLFLGGIRLPHMLLLGTASLAVIAGLLIQSPPYMRQRLATFVSPGSHIQSSGYQAFQSKLALGAGGIFGSGLGESTQKLYFLPYAHTDFIYSIVGEELGLVGTLGVLFLIGIFIWRGLVIARRAPDHFSRLLAAGLTLAIGIQALLHISIVLGLTPTTGLPLPLFSYGRSSLIGTLFAFGIILHISQRKTTVKRK